jgi:4-amino-4-deoxy-L-arabinose transferase-like glycosyltransferase
MFLRKNLATIKNILAENQLGFGLFLVAFFLRFYNFTAAVTFLGDQGRDAIIIKRIVTLEHFPAIGAPSSIGGIFLGPFYYYLVAPFLLLFHFNPVGPALAVALISFIGLIAFYFIVKKTTHLSIALYATALLVFSVIQINFSRFSWNPNLLPLFAFLTLYFFALMLKKQTIMWAIAFGSFFAFSLQLHYLAALLILPLVVIYCESLFNTTNKKLSLWKNLFFSLMAFGFFLSPLIIFELKHQFLNTQNFLQLFNSKSFVNHSSYWLRLETVLVNLFTHLFNRNFPSWLTLTIFFLLIIFYLTNRKTIKKNIFLNLNFLNVILYPLGFAFLNSPRYPHYYGAVYYSFFIVVSYLAFRQKKIQLLPFASAIFLLILFIFFNSQKYIFLKEGDNQIKKAEEIAETILAHHPQTPYQIVALPSTETDGHIRYFLEIKGKRPMPEDTNEYVKELYVLCRETNCSPDNNPQWQIASFKNAKIDTKWFIQDFYIYKIVHGN